MRIYHLYNAIILIAVVSQFTDSFVFRLRRRNGIIIAKPTSLSNLPIEFDDDHNSNIDIDVTTSDTTTLEYDIPTLKNVKYRINQIIEPSKIAAIKLRHIAVATQDLAQECKTLITSGAATFEKLAESLSLCTETKFKGGESSWLSMTPGKERDESKSLNFGPIPIELVNTAIYMNKGDIAVVRSLPVDNNNPNPETETERLPAQVSDSVVLPETWHVVQLIDVEMKLSISTIQRRRENFLNLKGNFPTSRSSSSSTSANEENSSSELTYFMDTMGCQMNVADSERMEAQLTHLGFKPTNDSSVANLVVLNTCSVRDHAEQKVYSYIGPHALRKRKGEDVSIVVAGCVAQQEGEVLARRFPEVDIVMGPQYANRLGELIESVAGGGEQVVATEPIYQMEDTLKSQRSSDISAFVNVIYGCNERCTFCVVPTTRGVEQSRTKEAVVGEIRDLARQGFREVTLLGQNVDAWGR